MDWEEGRRLVSANNGTTNLTFTYDSEGLRLSKTVGTTEHKYYYAGGKLLRETVAIVTEEDGETATETVTQDFFYDAMGTAYAVKYNGTLYYYITNLQGDILHIVDASGTPVVSYTYSPYGKPLSTTGTLADTLGADNPLRYRGYYYDTEASLYYLQSRYYDPELCRFINADAYASTGQGIIGCNMFVYCLNNPLNYLDCCGFSAISVPMIENGLNLPAGGGVPVIINGTVYYYAVSYSPSGALYEYWFDSQGNLVHVRHHSDHNKPHKHKDPHDHQGGKDKDGNNTIISGPQDVDSNFHSPQQYYNPSQRENEVLGYITAGSLLGFAIYSVAKWVVATIFAPPTGGGSYAVAGLMP